MSWVTAAEFSRKMQCSRANVTQGISSGRIAPDHVRRDGSRVMVSTGAIPDWQATSSRRRGINETPPSPTPAAKHLQMVPVEGLPALAWGAGDEIAMDATLTPEEIQRRLAELPEGAVPDLLLSRQRREHALAQLAELELEREQQKLVSAAEVSRERFESGRLVRDALLRVPMRVLPELAKAAGGLTPEQRTEFGLVLERHLNDALRSLAQEQLAPQELV
jgi:hypothetical protein